MWRNVVDLFRVAARRHNVLKPDARLNSEECKQVCGSECNIFPVEKAVEKCKQHANDNYEKKQRSDEREEKLKDCRPNWESSWVGALGWSGALVLGWYAIQPPCWRRFLHCRRKRPYNGEHLRCCSLLDVVSRYALSQPSPSPRRALLPVPVVAAKHDLASTQYGPPTAEQVVDEAAERFEAAQNEILGAVENNKGVQLMKAGEHKQAVAFFKRASSFQNARAAYNLGICYEKGLGSSRSLEEAVRWYELASSRGHAGAMYNLGVFYARGLGDLEVDRCRARQLFESAAELGQPDAARALEKMRRSARSKRSADDVKALYRALGVEVPREGGTAHLRSMPVSEAVVQALGLVSPPSEVLDLAFEGRKLPARNSISPSEMALAQVVSFCKSEVSDNLPSSLYASYVRV